VRHSIGLLIGIDYTYSIVYTIIAYIKKTESSQINNLMIYLKFLENKSKSNPKSAEDQGRNQ
jgi:hypothetical protein